ncbi:hypothetical protein FH972_014745 [Carpinus fangiana]|uniref:Long-chain-alcohol oxidase n=1 Tax=Carpinus fangiana TaxID=176857 RepID=A0A5N6RB03_9ROSI|nr:hypothetical protein FH972_014745 [Carpinus fangiana]
MQSLGSICETILPPLPSNSLEGEEEQPSNVAELFVKRALKESLILVRVVLWLLATKLGTLLLCGSLCFCEEWPFILSFSRIPLEKREQVLQNWSRSRFLTPIRCAFVYIKILCLFVFFSQVAELFVKRALKESLILVRVVLWLLATKLGTLLLCGSLCFCEEWPFILSFSRIPLEKREQVLQNWSRSRFLTPIRCAFVYIKILCLFVFFSQVDENGENPAWEAIGYHVGNDEDPSEVPQKRPLEKGMVETMHETDLTLVHSLAQKGIKARIDPRDNLFKIECDVVVVGSGCGGGVAAAVLACSGHKVIVLEKGNYFTASDYSSLEGPAWEQLYEAGGLLPSTDGGKIIMAGCKAERFILEKNKSGSKRAKKCLGVVAKTMTKNITKLLQIEAKVTISACGALLTPPLMISSGLKNHNIGRNLHLHPVVMAWGYFPESNTMLKGKSYEGGIITSVHKVVGEDSNIVRAIIETPALGPASFGVLCPWESGLDIKKRMVKYARTAHLITIIRDSGSGDVRTEGRIKYSVDASDRENLRAGLKQALRILVTAGAVEVGTHRSDGQRLKCKGINEKEVEVFLDTVSTAEGPLSLVENWTPLTSAHQMGSCRMGIDDKEGAVDENGESWEAKGLFVCDASVLPSAVGVNPMITIQSTAYCLSKKIAESIQKVPF